MSHRADTTALFLRLPKPPFTKGHYLFYTTAPLNENPLAPLHATATAGRPAEPQLITSLSLVGLFSIINPKNELISSIYLPSITH